MKTSATANGVVIGVLVFVLCLSGIAIFYEAQVIANQRAVILNLIERKP